MTMMVIKARTDIYVPEQFRADRHVDLQQLSGKYLCYADLAGADLSEADLTRTKLQRANLTGANLTEASLWRTTLTNAILTEADLKGAFLWKTNLWRADLTGADLAGAKYLAEAKHDNILRINLTRESPWPIAACVTKGGDLLSIGCQPARTIDEWEDMTDEEINNMSNIALEFWRREKEYIISEARRKCAEWKPLKTMDARILDVCTGKNGFGSLVCICPNTGRNFEVDTEFTDAEWKTLINAKGQTVEVAYRGFLKDGRPKSPSFKQIKQGV